MIVPNPYQKEFRTHRVQADISVDAFNHLRSVFPYHGSVQSVLSILIDDFLSALTANKITTQPLDEHTRTIVNSLLRRGAITSPAQASSPRDGRERTRKADRVSSVGKDKQPCLDRENKKGVGSEKDKGKQKAKV